jgi:hypothetical protein
MPELNSEAIDFLAASEFFRPIRKLALEFVMNPGDSSVDTRF